MNSYERIYDLLIEKSREDMSDEEKEQFDKIQYAGRHVSRGGGHHPTLPPRRRTSSASLRTRAAVERAKRKKAKAAAQDDSM